MSDAMKYIEILKAMKILELERKLNDSNAKFKKLEKQFKEVADVKLERIKLTKFSTIMFDMTVTIARSLKEAEQILDHTNTNEVEIQSKKAIKELKRAIGTIEEWLVRYSKINQKRMDKSMRNFYI